MHAIISYKPCAAIITGDCLKSPSEVTLLKSDMLDVVDFAAASARVFSVAK